MNPQLSSGREITRADCPSLAQLLDPLAGKTGPSSALEVSVVRHFASGDGRFTIPRLCVKGPEAGHDQIRIGLFAGLHGDEPAGCAALVEFAATLASDPRRAAGYDIVLYPVINPTGYERGTRENAQGLDLNREFWCGSTAPEIQAIEQELRTQEFDGIITLHADDTCEGLYGYAHGRTLEEALLKPALKAASAFLPLDSRTRIDGFTAREGLIHECFERVLSAPPEQRPKPFDLIIETPAAAPFGLQVSACVAALEEIIAIYPGFIAFAQDL